ncbi:MAG: ATP cone domain-containing protein, partial [Bacillota bacterium]
KREFKDKTPSVEQIQDLVEEVLMENGYHQTAKGYILYREEQNKKRKKWLSNGKEMDIWTNKYQFKNESFQEFFDRVTKGNNTIKTYIKNKYFSPAGRILANRGLQKYGKNVTYSNCYVQKPVKDNLESIFNTARDIARTFSYGGGCGLRLNNLRPRGSKVNNSAKTTTGAVSFSKLYDATSELIGQRGRRAALMLSMRDDHPDLEEFINVKTDVDAVTKANMSVEVSNDFMKAVNNNKKWKLNFNVEDTEEKIEKTVDANRIMNKLAYSNWYSAEPGMLYQDTIDKWNIMSEDDEYQYGGVNPCLTGDMKILTKFGYKKLNTFNDLSNVQLINVDGDISMGKIIKTGEKETIKINLSNNETIKCTPDHKFMTIKGEECKAENLKDKKILPFLNYKYDLINQYIKLGFIQGDGNLTRLNSEIHHGIEVNIGYKDEDIMVLFDKDNYTENSSGIEIYLKGYNNILEGLDFDSSILPERTFPKSYDNFTRKQKASFLNGCYSANGSVIKGHRVSYKTTCRKFAEQLSNTLKNDFDINNYITTNKSKKVKFKEGEYKCRESYDVNISRYKSIKKFYYEIGFYQKYKEIQLKNLLKEKAPYVRSIKNNGIKTVYDFTEPMTHWGVVNGYVTHNCSEKPLPPGGSCLLSSINLSKLVKNPYSKKAKFDMHKFIDLVKQGVIYLNEVLEEGSKLHPLEEQQKIANDWKEIGLGIMGLADLFIKMGVRYGSKESLHLSDEIGSTMINAALQQSALLAKKEGTFPKYKADAVLNSPFILENTTDETYKMIEKYGLRNAALLSIAPTGSISQLFNIEGGIEPIFDTSYTRTTKSLHEGEKDYKVFTPIVREYMQKKGIKDEENLPNFIVTAHDLDYKERIDVQAVWQQYIDASISSTINLDNDTTVQEVKDLYMYAWSQHLKGVTIFRNGCARAGILSNGDNENNKTEMTKQDFIDEGICPNCKSELKHVQGCLECRNCSFGGCEI